MEADLKRKKKQRQLHRNVLNGLVTNVKIKMETFDLQDTTCEDDVIAVLQTIRNKREVIEKLNEEIIVVKDDEMGEK